MRLGPPFSRAKCAVSSFDFIANRGKHWRHSHIPVQELDLLAAPLIVRRPEDIAADRQEETILPHDLSFRPAADVLIAVGTLALAWVLFGWGGWPNRGYLSVAVTMILMAVGYTIFSEWLNVEVPAHGPAST